MLFSINPIGLFKGLAPQEYLPLLKQEGFSTFELWTLQESALPALQQSMAQNSMALSAFCPDFFTLNDAACHAAYLHSLTTALARAKTLHCPALITQVGSDTGAPRAQQHAAIAEGLRLAAPLLERAGVTLLVEPLNDVKDHKGYYLTSSAEGFDIIREVGSPNVRLLYDVYHQLHMGEDVLQCIRENLPLIGHIHIAGFPDRDERLFTGFDHTPLLELLKQQNSPISVGIELFTADVDTSIALLRQLRAWA